MTNEIKEGPTEGPLTKVQRIKYAAAGKIIREGEDTFLKVGDALTAVRDERLYREEYDTFESYVKEQLGWSKAHAYRLICSSQVADNVSHGRQTQPKLTERQARELGKAPPEKQAEAYNLAFENAAADNRKPTAEDCKEAVEQIRQQTLLDVDGEELTSDAELIEYEDDEEEIAADEPEWWLNRTQADSLKKTLAVFKKELNAIVEAPGLELLVQNRKRIVMDLGNIQTVLNGAMPYDRCPYCNGLANDCRGCSDRGWVVRSVFNSAPKELRDGVARLSAGGDS